MIASACSWTFIETTTRQGCVTCELRNLLMMGCIDWMYNHNHVGFKASSQLQLRHPVQLAKSDSCLAEHACLECNACLSILTNARISALKCGTSSGPYHLYAPSTLSSWRRFWSPKLSGVVSSRTCCTCCTAFLLASKQRFSHTRV